MDNNNPYSEANTLDDVNRITQSLKENGEYTSVTHRQELIRRVQIRNRENRENDLNHPQLFLHNSRKRSFVDTPDNPQPSTSYSTATNSPSNTDSSQQSSNIDTATQSNQSGPKTNFTPQMGSNNSEVLYRGQFFELVTIKKVVAKKFNTDALDYRMIVRPEAYSDNLQTARENIEMIFEELLAHLFDHLPDNYYARFVISSIYP